MNARALSRALLVMAAWFAGAPARADEPAAAVELDVSALAASSERLYVGSFDQGLYVLERGRPLRAVPEPALSPHINALAWSERERVLWVGTARGLARCPVNQACTRIGPESGVHAVVVSATGAVLAGGDAGLIRVEGERVRTFGKKEGAPFRSVWALAELGERLFVGTTSGLFWGAPAAFSGKQAELGRAAIVLGTLPDDWVTALAVRQTTLFVGTYSAGVAEFRNAAAELVATGAQATLGYVNPAGIATFGDECVAVATMDGLKLGEPSHAVPIPTRARDVTAFVPDPNGGFWIGTRAGLEFWNGACPSSERQAATER